MELMFSRNIRNKSKMVLFIWKLAAEYGYDMTDTRKYSDKEYLTSLYNAQH